MTILTDSQIEPWAAIRAPRPSARATRRAVRLRAERSSLREKVQSVSWRRSKEDTISPSCESDRPGIVVVSHPGDLVAHMVSTFLRYDDIPVWDISPHQLGDLQYEIRRGELYLQDCPIDGVMLRWSRCPDEGLTSGQHCGDPLVIASWLAAADLGRTRIVNSYDSESWRGGAGWAVWEHRLSESGVPTLQTPSSGREHRLSESGVPTLQTNSVPLRGLATSVIACGEVIDGPRSASVLATAGILAASGVQLATVDTLPDGTVTDVDTQPDIIEARTARRAANSIIDHMTEVSQTEIAGALSLVAS